MSKRWSKLQSRLYNLMDPTVGFQIHTVLYEMNSNDGYHGSKLPRYFITIGKKIIFDFPKDFPEARTPGKSEYPWITDISDISDVIEEYIQRPEAQLMEPFENDKWGITDILRACDRRMGKRRLKELRECAGKEVVRGIVEKRSS